MRECDREGFIVEYDSRSEALHDHLRCLCPVCRDYLDDRFTRRTAPVNDRQTTLEDHA